MSINTVAKVRNEVFINNVLVSTADKTSLDLFVPAIMRVNPDVRFYSTGGTYAHLKNILGENGALNLIKISDYTGQPEMQGGLVKTLDFKIYLGLLSESYNQAHSDDLKRTMAVEFDMVVGNLYPFKDTIADAASTLENARGNIDIGGPCMLRAGAKNFHRVAVVCDPSDYEDIADDLAENGGKLTLKKRFALAQKAFSHTAEYDELIQKYLLSVDPDTILDTYDIQ